MKKILLLTGIFTLLLLRVNAQTEFLVTVNPINGTDSIIDSLPGVNYIYNCSTTFDKNHHRYIFQGIDFSSNSRLYCVDANTGAILSQPIDSVVAYDIKYDNSVDSLYGLYVDNNTSTTYVVSINITTGKLTFLGSSPVNGFASGVTYFQESNHTYHYQNGNSFISISVDYHWFFITRATASYNGLEFNNSTGILYGLVMNNSNNQMYTVNIDTLYGTYTTLDTLPTFGYVTNQVSLNETNNVYTFCNPDSLYSVSTITGRVLYSPMFPLGIVPPQNVIELHYDNSNGILYALHWGTLPVGTGDKNINGHDNNELSIFPNPFTNSTTVAVSTEGKHYLEVYDITGRKLQSIEFTGKQYVLSAQGLAKGMYFVRVFDNQNALIGTSKIVVE